MRDKLTPDEQAFWDAACHDLLFGIDPTDKVSVMFAPQNATPEGRARHFAKHVGLVADAVLAERRARKDSPND